MQRDYDAPLICVAMDLNQRWVMDMGLPGPDAGQGGRHVLLPPGHEGDVRGGYCVGRSSTFRVLAGIRALLSAVTSTPPVNASPP